MILMTSGEVLDDEARESSGFASLACLGEVGCITIRPNGFGD